MAEAEATGSKLAAGFDPRQRIQRDRFNEYFVFLLSSVGAAARRPRHPAARAGRVREVDDLDLPRRERAARVVPDLRPRAPRDEAARAPRLGAVVGSRRRRLRRGLLLPRSRAGPLAGATANAARHPPGAVVVDLARVPPPKLAAFDPAGGTGAMMLTLSPVRIGFSFERARSSASAAAAAAVR